VPPLGSLKATNPDRGIETDAAQDAERTRYARLKATNPDRGIETWLAAAGGDV